MPYYSFKCDDCNIEKDELVKMGTTESTCSKCGKPTRKTMNSFKTVALGLPNGHIAIKDPKQQR